METLILNSSKKIDEIRSIFDSYKIDINLKNLLHIEDISPNTTGILITNEFEISIIKPIVEFAIKNNIKNTNPKWSMGIRTNLFTSDYRKNGI